jgi:hypothetical protein
MVSEDDLARGADQSLALISPPLESSRRCALAKPLLEGLESRFIEIQLVLEKRQELGARPANGFAPE